MNAGNRQCEKKIKVVMMEDREKRGRLVKILGEVGEKD